MCLLGGALCVLAGILCLVAVSWSTAATISIYNEGHVTAALKREVGSSICIGWASSVLLLLGGALICFVCGERERTPPPYYSYTQVHEHTSLAKAQSGLFNQPQETQPGSEQGTFGRNPSNRSGRPDKGKGLFMGMKPNLVHDLPSRATTVPYDVKSLPQIQKKEKKTRSVCLISPESQLSLS